MKKCPKCNAEFEPVNKQIYCSEKCRRKKVQAMKSCKCCGNKFKPVRKNQILCGDPKCRSKRLNELAKENTFSMGGYYRIKNGKLISSPAGKNNRYPSWNGEKYPEIITCTPLYY